MSSVAFTSVYEVAQQVVFYMPSKYGSHLFVQIGTIQEINYQLIDDEVLYDITVSPGVIVPNVPEENIFALTDTFQKLVTLVTAP